jgi:hypothetical protein
MEDEVLWFYHKEPLLEYNYFENHSKNGLTHLEEMKSSSEPSFILGS